MDVVPRLIRRQKSRREETNASEDRSSSQVEENDRTTKDERRSSSAPQANDELLPLNGNRRTQCEFKEANRCRHGRMNSTSSAVLIRTETVLCCPLSSEESSIYARPSTTHSNRPDFGRRSSMKVTVKDNSSVDERREEEALTPFLPSNRMQEKRSEEEETAAVHSKQTKKTISVEDKSTTIDERQFPFRTTEEDRESNFAQNNGNPAAETEVDETLADDVTAKQTGNTNPLTCTRIRKKISSKDRSFTSLDCAEETEEHRIGRAEKYYSTSSETTEKCFDFKAEKTLSSGKTLRNIGKSLQNCSVTSDRRRNISMFNLEKADSSEKMKFLKEFPLLESRNSRLADDGAREGKDRLEKTHMTRDEVRLEAQRQGLILYNSVPNSPLDSADDLSCEVSCQQTTNPAIKSKTAEEEEETKRPHGRRPKKGSIFNLRTWLDKLSLSSGEKSLSRRQYISYSSSGRSARTLALAPCQRRSLSASSNPRNRKSSGNVVVNDDGDDVIDSGERSNFRFFSSSTMTKSATISRRSKAISASGSLGSATSCQSMVVSPSTGSLCSVFSQDGDNEQHSSNDNNTGR